MKTLILSVSLAIAFSAIASAAPVASVASSQASPAKQKIDRFLSQQVVAEQLAQLGVSRDQIDGRLARLSDEQLQAVANQIDTLQAGGMIQGGNPNPLGTLKCIFEPLGRLFYNIWQTLFCWGKLK